MHVPEHEVGIILRELASTLVLPRFRALGDGDVTEKTPGEIVTIVDREVEDALVARLVDLLPHSRAVGEEASSHDPTLLSNLDRGVVWLIDPLDGTNNFAHHREQFSMMVTLLNDGATLASWMYTPLTDVLARAARDRGAFLNDERVYVNETVVAPAGVVKTQFLPQDLRAKLERNLHTYADGSGSAGIDYPDLVRGHWRFLLYWRTLPWDHAPGALFVQEAGGHVARLDGREYRAADAGEGLLIAPSYSAWLYTRATLLGTPT